MLLICGGLMRTGSVAMFQVMREIVERNGGYAPVLRHGEEAEQFDATAKHWAEDKKPLVLKLHRWRDSLEGLDTRVVMTIRDMRDVTVSLMNFRGGGFEAALHSGAFKGNLDGQEEWEKTVPKHKLLKVRYEDFVMDRPRTTLQVARFMGINIPGPEAVEIERKWNLQANKLRAKEGHSIDSIEYMSERHIQSGATGQWQTELTPDQIMDVQKRVGLKWFLDNGYPPYDLV